VFAVGEERGYEVDFGAVFGDVRLHWEVCFFPQLAEGREYSVRAGWRESWSDDRRDEILLWVNVATVLNTSPLIPDRGLYTLVPVILWTHTIHANPPHERSLTLGFANVCKAVGGFDVDGCVVACCGGSVGEGAGYDAGVDFLGHAERREGGFEGEGIGFQPGEEGGFAEEAGIGVLGGVDVGVWPDVLALILRHWRAGGWIDGAYL